MQAYFDLGDYSRTITTDSAQAQLWFDRGLMWIYCFNHHEAKRCFEKAIEVERTCAMAHWGLAYAHGPYINKPWYYYTEQELIKAVPLCYQTAQEALRLSESASPVEQALIYALTQRYQSDQVVDEEKLAQWNDEYAAAMLAVHQAFPEDLDVITLFVEAMMIRTPWKLWDIAIKEPMPNANTLEMMSVLAAGQRFTDERGLPPHPGILHMHIHTMEMSPYPEQALRSADMLRGFAADAGHLLHMPGHIYVQCGHYYDALAISREAIAADRKYLQHVGPFTRYTSSYCHDLHLMMFTAMFLAQYQPALEAAKAITEILTDDVLRHAQGQFASSLEGYYSMRMHVYVRFGKWQEIIDEPLPTDAQLHPVTSAMFRYARAVAYAALGQQDKAELERTAFQEAYDRIPASRYFFNNYARDTLNVAESMMHGEVEYHQGNYDVAFEHLRRAVERNDNLAYTEPSAWMHPPRHALGALLLAQGHVVEAEAVYRADLGIDAVTTRSTQHPNNVWSLHGYAECLRQQGKTAELSIIEPALTLALARTDVPIHASCCCRIEAAEAACCH